MLFTSATWSQKWVEKGHQQFQNLEYSGAIISLEKAVKKGFKTTQIYTELGDCYYFNANYQAAAKWYQLAFEQSQSFLPLHILRYSQSLKSIGKIKEAEMLLRKLEEVTFLENNGNIDSNELFIDTTKFKNAKRFHIKLTNFNSVHADFGPAYFGNQIVFASTRDTGNTFKRKHSWTNESFTDLYQVNLDSMAVKPTRFIKAINSKFNETSAVFTKDGLTMYFTRNNYANKKRGSDENQTTLLKIYKAILKDKKWILVGALPFCNDNFNVAHPALSFDEKTLYFASDMPGGFGLSDLYQVAILEDNSFGNPENLGSMVNSLGRDTFPFVSQNSELYFASDGRDGFGGLDIYAAYLDENRKYKMPFNVGKPINSMMDDFGYIINSENKTGYFTSNRSNGIGMDDIYAFTELFPLPCKTLLEGTISAENPQQALSGVEIVLLDANSNRVATTTSNKNGQYRFEIDCHEKYVIQIQPKGFIYIEIAIEPASYQTTFVDEIVLQKEIPAFQIGDDLSKKIVLLPILFDLGKHDIRPDAVQELLKIKSILVAFPSLSIEVRSHTDSRDTAKKNQLLSARRADATINWLIESGIEGKRLSGNGFGENQLLNKCNDAVPCSEAEHQSNRRSEFIVTGI
jgi:outer membrane protein OmpA-like peptidoglycan-associated protein